MSLFYRFETGLRCRFQPYNLRSLSFSQRNEGLESEELLKTEKEIAMRNTILWSLLLVAFFIGCDDEDQVIMKSDISAPVLQELSGQGYVVDENMNADDSVAQWQWTAVDYGYSAAINYAVEVDVSESFENAVEITSVNGDTTALITAGIINDAAANFVTETSEITFYVRIKASINSISFDSPVEPLYSNVKEFTFTAYVVPPEYPETMYMIGTDFGGWDWNSEEVVEMTPVYGVEGAFWCIRYFNAANGFKWSPSRAWGEDFFMLDEAIGYTESDGNAFVPEDGIYMVYIDMAAGTITIEPAQVYGIGDCFGSWDTETYPFTVSGDKMTITTTATGELRMYAGSSAATSDWWTREFIILDGEIVYRGTGPDQERVTVEAGSVITLDFNAGTGTIE